jgi:ketosteroid isomerase-like protein
LRIPVAVTLVALVVASGCGGGDPSPESVVRAWSQALNSGDNEAAADLFAPGAEVIQGVRFTLDTKRDAIAFNEALPCSGEIVELVTEGDSVRATFRLGDRPASRCDAPGAEVDAAFRVRKGKIVLWHQLPGSSDEGEGRAI